METQGQVCVARRERNRENKVAKLTGISLTKLLLPSIIPSGSAGLDCINTLFIVYLSLPVG